MSEPQNNLIPCISDKNIKKTLKEPLSDILVCNGIGNPWILARVLLVLRMSDVLNFNSFKKKKVPRLNMIRSGVRHLQLL